MAIPVYVPFGFIVLVVGGLGLFSKIYRRRQAGLSPNRFTRHSWYSLTRLCSDWAVRDLILGLARTYQPWFPPHHERNVYITLLQHTDPKPHDALLKAALLRRAVADVKRIFRIRDDKAALASLLQKGSIDDELWANFQAAEKELEAEIVEVVTEANTFADGWGQIIFQSAGEIAQNEKQREIYGKIAANRKAIGEEHQSSPSSCQPAYLRGFLTLS
jgi:translocation protein SEC66